MSKYRLNDLGWYQFERVVQSLLKSKCGLTLESWGKNKDWGRDAFSSNPLRFPFEEQNDGPFIFQVKFVENAFSSDQKLFKQLENSVNAEIKSIQIRKQKEKSINPKYYTLITNFPLTSGQRTGLGMLVRNELSDSQIIIWGESDVSDLLDQNPHIRQSFPQILGLQDLDKLIDDVINRDIKLRSEDIIENAKECVEIFVPTNAYRKCLEYIKNNNFVVIEGPPEVGKTVIAWMVSLLFLTNGYEAFLCNRPEDFFKVYRKEKCQIFVADDAFGRTEYDITRGRQWEEDLDKILRKIDKDHILIWTSRKHIFERALHQMDLQGKANNFPHKADLIVDAADLSIEEKALMLYRHAKRAKLDEVKKRIIRKQAKIIVMHEYLTPERIRYLVEDYFSKNQIKEMNTDNIRNEIREVIRKPTDRMKKTFDALSLSHKLVLLTLLGESDNVSEEELHNSFNKKYGKDLDGESFDDLLVDLSESFIRSGK